MFLRSPSAPSPRSPRRDIARRNCGCRCQRTAAASQNPRCLRRGFTNGRQSECTHLVRNLSRPHIESLNHSVLLLSFLKTKTMQDGVLVKQTFCLALCLSIVLCQDTDTISAREHIILTFALLGVLKARTVGGLLCSCAADGVQVCATDGMEYPNSGCGLFCTGYEVVCEGPCPCADCPCPMNKAFVCGVNGVSYRNRCFAACADMPIACDGKCPCSNALSSRRC